jgi:HD superfamily phosphohydrolase
MRTIKRIRTVLYGDQRLTSAELEVLHTPAMQRLYGLKQLGLTDRIFIDASHARIHHVVGVLRQIDKLVFAIIYNLRHSKRELRISAPSGATPRVFVAREFAQFVRSRKSVIRFIGLLHDLTHAPFGHTIEDEIRLVDTKHDQPERQADAFYRLLCQLVAWLCLEAHGPEWERFPESLRPFLSQGANAQLPDALEVGGAARDLITGLNDSTARICLGLTPKYIAEMLAHLGCSMTALLHLQALHEPNPSPADLPSASGYPFQELIRSALEKTPFESLHREFQFDPQRDAFMLDIVGNTVCADLLDYARRDSHFAGLHLDYDQDRIAENFTLVEVDSSVYNLNHPEARESSAHAEGQGADELQGPFKGWCLRTAISLVSHKYRTDVPSELMNLLNVRFYLFERVIFHPTKCAAGAMLGTSLQLLGWRKNASGERPVLPAHLRFVGDDVFLHDICAALDFVTKTVSALPDDSRIGSEHVSAIANMDSAHSGLAPMLLRLRVGQTAKSASTELNAARLLLNRLMSRRYFRPVFRALPSSKNLALQSGAKALADRFRQPDLRYKAEREIEHKADLPLGTITIHCPTWTTARKIANVYLTKPDDAGDDVVCKLKDIGELDKEIFGEHQNAVEAVEKMYGSMWRLTVYVAPEHLENWEMIVSAAGAVFSEEVDVHNHFGDRPNRGWPNDPNLQRELSGRMVASFGDTVGEEDLTLFGEVLGQIGEDLLGSDRLRNISGELYNSNEGLSAEGRRRIEDALVGALSKAAENATDPPRRGHSPSRSAEVITIAKGYIRMIGNKNIDRFERIYGDPLKDLDEKKFEAILSDLKAAVTESIELDKRNSEHKGHKFAEFEELFRGLMAKYGGSTDGLFGDQSE